MDGRPTWTDCDEAGDYVVPNVLSPRDLVFRPDIMDETVPHIYMAKAAAEGLFLSRRILKCLTKIKSNNLGIDTHASLCWVIFADLSSFM